MAELPSFREFCRVEHGINIPDPSEPVSDWAYSVPQTRYNAAVAAYMEMLRAEIARGRLQ